MAQTSARSQKGSREAGPLESKHLAVSQGSPAGPLKQERTGFKPELVPPESETLVPFAPSFSRSTVMKQSGRGIM